ncbi:transcriptional regulator [Candidatus Nitrosopumilus sp. SW]|uniref:transcriptional regulator n=1 Tax=Candidatus Nitrosopumilus sp. SW TaxID=2508726 RepID=UPI00114FDCA2|nr:transcriptional regulator [Candidatus Nitrosopumilus sp. SW]QDI89068.1 transcriptional regulator [Candidatus Nitrosopumilus sp. SW]
MAGLDRLISTSLRTKIKKKIDVDTLKKIERELFLEHGMSIKLSAEHFQTLLKIIKKNSELDIDEFEKECLKEIIQVKKVKENYHLTILDPKLIHFILDIFGDDETRKMIISILKSEHTIPEILRESGVPKTSGYRKIENLLIKGFFIETGKVLSESKKISKIQCVFQEILIDAKKEKLIVSGIVPKKIFEKSTTMKSIIKNLE